MLILAAAVLAATPPAEPRVVAPARQAQAVVRIIKSAALRFSELDKSQPQLFRETKVRSAGGSIETTRLIEFQ